MSKEYSSCVVALVGGEELAVATEICGDCGVVPQPIIAIAASDSGYEVEHTFHTLFKPQIYGCLLLRAQPFESLDVLMVLQHLHGRNVVGVYVVCGYAVMIFHKIKAFDIQVFNRLALIGDLSGVRDRYARHFLQNVRD